MFGWGFCQKHYLRWKRHGDPNYTTRITPGTPLKDRLLGRWEERPGPLDTPCWEWTGRRSPDGYGMLKYEGWNQGTHRLMYRVEVGDIPAGMSILHRCDNPPCINPAHLRPGTQRDNVQDMHEKGRGRARRGLSDSQVRQIRSLVRGGMKQSEVVKIMGVDSGTVSRIVNRVLYRDIA